MTTSTQRQALINTLAKHLPVGTWTLEGQPAGITILWLLPAGTEKLAELLAEAGVPTGRNSQALPAERIIERVLDEFRTNQDKPITDPTKTVFGPTLPQTIAQALRTAGLLSGDSQED